MNIQKDPDKSNSTQTEVKHLKATIDALSSELENHQADKQQSIKRAVADANDEIAQLKETIIALREELEGAMFDKQQSVRGAIVNAREEIAQLKGTIISLRKQLEQQNQLSPDEKIKP